MTIDLGFLALDEGLVLAQLRQDLKDDWFPDARGFDDMFKSKQIQQVVLDNFSANAGVYKPRRADVFNVPKSNFTLRYSLETSIADRTLYHGLVADLVEHFDPLLPWSVYNHRRSTVRSAKRYLFNNSIEAWRNFLGSVRVAVKTSPVLLSTDLTNYYENISLEKLEATMIGLVSEINAPTSEKAQVRQRLKMLFEYLPQWCFRITGGLPQNRDASSFLANLYMLPVDREMLKKGYRYFRYMDDIKIVCRDKFQARRALKDLSLALRTLGLSVNSGKTKICGPEDDDDVAQALEIGAPELQQLSAIWSSRSIKPISRSFPLLRSFTKALLAAGEIDSKAFRFCVHRLEALALCPEFAPPAAYFADITPAVIEALSTHPAGTDKLAGYLAAVELSPADLEAISALLRDGARSIYTWQSYRLWTLLIQKGYLCALLMDHALEAAASGSDDANRSGAMLYAGAMGTKAERLSVAEGFKSLTSFHGQRAAIVAVQELPYGAVRQLVQPHLRKDLVGVYRGIKNAKSYFVPLQHEPITNYIDADRQYD
jgi:hypothetical protein